MRTDTTAPGERDHRGIWTETCDRIVELLSSVPESVADTEVPTVSGATVRDILTHLLRTTSDGAKTAAVELPASGQAKRSQTLAELLDEWRSGARKLDEVVGSEPAEAAIRITDAVMCEHDLRTALDRAGARDDDAIRVALDELSGRFSDRVAAMGLPALRVTVEQWGTIVGDGRAVRCVVADRFEFVRAMSGRRSAAEIRRWNWGVDPETYLAVMSESPLPEREIHERDPRVPEHMRDREFVL